MIIPSQLYNPTQEDQSIRGYIKAYDEAIEIINERIENDFGFPEMPGFSHDDITMGLQLCYRVNIILRMVHIFEKYCDEEPNLVVS